MTRPVMLAGMLRTGLLATALLALPVVVAAVAVAGVDGLAGAAAGVLLVVLFCGSTLVVMRVVRDAEPRMQMAVALGVYGTKTSLLLLTGPLVRAAGPEALTWGAVAITGSVLAWTVGLLVAAVRTRQLVYDVDSPVPSGPSAPSGEEVSEQRC